MIRILEITEMGNRIILINPKHVVIILGADVKMSSGQWLRTTHEDVQKIIESLEKVL